MVESNLNVLKDFICDIFHMKQINKMQFENRRCNERRGLVSRLKTLYSHLYQTNRLDAGLLTL